MNALKHLLALSLFLLACTAASSASAADSEIQVTVEKRGELFVADSSFALAVPLPTAWEVFTDFDHMTGIMSNLNASRISQRHGNTLQVEQEGVARYGLFSFAFTSEREIRLLPMKKIISRQLSGNARQFVSEMELSREGSGTRVRYHAEMALDSFIARTFGAPFIEHEIAEQFTAMAAEMVRRKAP
jgi:hypothetical protein